MFFILFYYFFVTNSKFILFLVYFEIYYVLCLCDQFQHFLLVAEVPSVSSDVPSSIISFVLDSKVNNVVDKSSKENMNSFVSVPSKESVNVDYMENIRYKFREESENREVRRNLETLSEVEEDMREQNERQEKKGYFLLNSVSTKPKYESNSASCVEKREQHDFNLYEQSKNHLSKERVFQRSKKLPRTPPDVQSPSHSDIVDLCIVNSEESPVFTKRKLHKPSPKKGK